jgi:hypothetical protein
MERLKKSMIEKSDSVSLKTTVSTSKKTRIRRIYSRFVLRTRGGDLDDVRIARGEFLAADADIPPELVKLASDIQNFVENLTSFLKKKELQGVGKFFFRGGRVMLELILINCNVKFDYAIIKDGLKIQVAVITIVAGGAIGFISLWLDVGSILTSPLLLVAILGMRSVHQQILNFKDFLQFEKILADILQNEGVTKTVRITYIENESPVAGKLTMEQMPLNTESVGQYDFNMKSEEQLDEFVKNAMKDQLGLIENPNDQQFQEILQRKVIRKKKGKTVNFSDFLGDDGVDFSNLDIVDAEILFKEPINMRLDD